MAMWNLRNRPERLEKRFEFQSYEETRVFLDSLGEFSELRQYFPDISFGKTYVNITLRPNSEDSEATITQTERKFAEEIDGLLG